MYFLSLVYRAMIFFVTKINYRYWLCLFVGVFLIVMCKCSLIGKKHDDKSNPPNLNLILESTTTELSNLELAERATTEILERTESRKLPLLPISIASYSVRFNVKYSYMVSAEPGKWSINEEKGIIHVVAPEIQPKEPCVDSNSIGAVSGGVLIFNKKQKLESLKSTVSAVARERAKDKKGMDLIRENCRRSIGKIIMKWAKRYGIESNAVLVRFQGEMEE